MTLGCTFCLLFATFRWISCTNEQAAPSETMFVPIDVQVAMQRRRDRLSPADVLIDGVLFVTLPTGWVVATLFGGPLAVLLVGVSLSFWILPQARRQALLVYNHDLAQIKCAMVQINRLDRWILTATFLGLVLTLSSSDGAPVWTIPGIALPVRTQTFRPGRLTSRVRDGTVDHYRVRTSHTDSHWVFEVRQPITFRIPREDTDLADVMMVLLHRGESLDGKSYLDQATTGLVFGLSRQMTNVRIALYKRRQRIEDVLGRERHNHTLTPPVVEAIHRAILDDPLGGATAIRRRLIEDSVLSGEDDISLITIDRASQTVDYLAVRARIHQMLAKGEIVPDHQKLARILLREMGAMAASAGKKAGRIVVPIAQLLATPQQTSDGLEAGPVLPATDLSDRPTDVNRGVPPCLRWAFLLYFTLGASYREVGTYLGVWASTVYRRLTSLRERLPPLQEVLGPLRYSKVVALDEKFILAPGSHRGGKMGRWVYLFLAIDPYSYDLLHAEVYPCRTADYARAFLLGLKAKGVLSPNVVVTDLWGPYETVIPEIYPGAVHHQCVFHAEQATSTLMRDKLGADYTSVPAARALKSAIIHLFRAESSRTLKRRYKKLLGRKPGMIECRPELACVFDSLEGHFEKVANAYTCRLLSIPKTNNAVETVIRCFTRRYKTMAGLQTLETAREYVRLWEYYYRFRPFSPDASRRIRNRSPLQIAGYEVHGLTCLDLVMPPPHLEAASRA